MNKIRKFVGVTLGVAKLEDINSLVVALKVLVAYFRYGLGVKNFSSYGLVHKKVSTYTNYMRKNELEAIQRQVNSEQGCAIADDKLLFHQACAKFGLPTPTVIGCLSAAVQSGSIHGVPYIRGPDHLLALVTNHPAKTFLFKPNYGHHGQGLIRFSLLGDGLVDDLGHPLPADKLLNRLCANDNAYLLQPALRPHVALRPIMPGKGLGTSRIVTINHEGNVVAEFAFVRIPVGNNVADNFVGGSTGNLLADIDIHSGIIGNCVAPAVGNANLIETCERHPESGEMITGFQFPCWPDMIDTATRAALKLDSLCTVGWDVALTEAGPVLLEANCRYDIDALQITTRRGLKPELMAKLEPAMRGA